ncbi:AraC family ligand binding domain-containing protein [Paenibacillus albus]|nr:AraC family ligand binding domain-containing protein [Paenibacillus albus]
MERLKTTYYFDNIEEPVIIPFTPLAVSRRLPYQLCTIGYVHFAGGFYTEREKQRNYQIIYTDEGSGLLTYNGKKFELDKGTAVFINCYEPHYYHTGIVARGSIVFCISRELAAPLSMR